MDPRREIDRVVAFLESWASSLRGELDDFRDRLDREAQFFRRDGSFTEAGWQRYHAASTHDQERLDDIGDQIRGQLWRIRYIGQLVRYARATAEGTVDIAEADKLYAGLTTPADSPRSGRRTPQ